MGYTVDIPRGWTRSQKRGQSAPVVVYDAPADGRRLQVFRIAEDTPAQSLDLAENDPGYGFARQPGYRVVDRATGTTWAELTYRYDDSDLGARQVVDHRFQAADGTLYAIRAAGPASSPPPRCASRSPGRWPPSVRRTRSAPEPAGAGTPPRVPGSAPAGPPRLRAPAPLGATRPHRTARGPAARVRTRGGTLRPGADLGTGEGVGALGARAEQQQAEDRVQESGHGGSSGQLGSRTGWLDRPFSGGPNAIVLVSDRTR